MASLEHIERLARGQLSDALPHKLNAQEFAEFDMAQTRGYSICKRVNLKNIWWLWCEFKDHPYVLVEPRRKYCTVEMDLLASNRCLPDEALRILDDAVRGLAQRSKKWRFTIGDIYSSVENLVPEDAHAVAAKFVTIAQTLAKKRW